MARYPKRYSLAETDNLFKKHEKFQKKIKKLISTV